MKKIKYSKIILAAALAALAFGCNNPSSPADALSTPIKAAAPVISPNSGTISEFTEVSMDVSAGTTAYYTTDGSVPSETSSVYTAPFTLPVGSVTLMAYAVADGSDDSDFVSIDYTVEAQAEVPAVSDASLFQLSGSTVSLSTTSGLEAIFYTIDGSDPAVSGLAYTAPIAINDSITLRAIADGTGYYPSSELSVEYKAYENVAGLAVDIGSLMAASPAGNVTIRNGGSYYDLSTSTLSARALSVAEPAGSVLDFTVNDSGSIYALYLTGTDLIYWTSDAGTVNTVSTDEVNLADARILTDSSGNARIAFAQYADTIADELVEVVYSPAGNEVRRSVYAMSERATAVDAVLDSRDVLSIAVSEVKLSYEETAVVAYDEISGALVDVLAWKNRAGSPAMALRDDESLVMGYLRPDKNWFILLDVDAGVDIYTMKSVDTSFTGDSVLTLDAAGNIYAATAGSIWYYDGMAEIALPFSEAPYRITDSYILGASGMTLYNVK
ncbi:MAG: chitobiase/beta-hexosaminidase C-terminal domain-containing protein [Spirochaetaceae bacterium]|nr:chitobiase/beta-hexosaminidase C-terminal domain-containing protein [Spirochaetaceae bacterium]MDT8298579.1 chitobiase/beta-hexosaminidase C-terminal domain-containing protein [Spirochaetaceae bacterium]